MAGFVLNVVDRVLHKGLDVASLRHQVIASNLANVDTPGFKALDVTFEESLRYALAAGETREEGDIEGVTPTIYQVPARAFRNDGNTVDVDFEVVKLAQNTHRYIAFADILRRRFALWRQVATGGR